MSLESAFDKAFDDAAAARTDGDGGASDTPEPTGGDTAPGTDDGDAPDPGDPPETAPTADDTPSAEPAATPPDDEEEEDLSVPAEEIAAIKADPRLAKLFKGMQKAFTQKTMALGQQRALLQALENPETRVQAAKVIAAAANLKIAEDTSPTPPAADTPASKPDDIDTRLNEVFTPEAAKLIKPIFQDLVHQAMEARLAPVAATTEALQLKARAQESEANVNSFKAKYKGEITPEIEKAMVALSQKIRPAEGVTEMEYLDYLFHVARPSVSAKSAVKQVAERVAKAVATVEPRGGPNASRVESSRVTRKMGWDEAFDVAFQEAQAELGR